MPGTGDWGLGLGLDNEIEILSFWSIKDNTKMNDMFTEAVLVLIHKRSIIDTRI